MKCKTLLEFLQSDSRVKGLSFKQDVLEVYTSLLDEGSFITPEIILDTLKSTYPDYENIQENDDIRNEIIDIIDQSLSQDNSVSEEFIDETYSDEELDDMVGKVYNQQKIQNIYRRKKYDDKRLFASTICVNCGREKKVFLSNLVNDPEKYGSCVCSDTNVDSKIDYVQKLYNGTKVLSSNTSGYTGVTFVKNYRGQPYNKWRAYIEVDGVRNYLGDFDLKKDAIKARKLAGEKGIKWYKDNRNKLMRDVRKKTKKYATSKYRDSARKTSVITKK